MLKIFLKILCLSFCLQNCFAFWKLHNLQEFLNKFVVFSLSDVKIKKTVNNKELKEICDENQLILQLARLHATSPERIILLIATNSLSKTCLEVSKVLEHINHTVSECAPLPSENLYMKLYNGLDYYNSYICLHNFNSNDNHLNNYHDCLTELREDLLDCEGPADWFEKPNESIVCEYYSQIIDCNYIKAAMLCGLKPALILRIFSNEIMNKIVKFKCKISRSLPYIDDPMPASATCHLKCHLNVLLLTYSSLFVGRICVYLFLHYYL